jgi:hypothetical protein
MKPKKVKEEDPATREMLRGKLGETGQIKTETSAGADGKSVEGCKKIGSTRVSASAEKEVSGVELRA